MSTPEPVLAKLPGDTVEGTDPLAFALAFVTAMRKAKAVVHIPSLRTTLSIPRFIAARWFRLRALTPNDYLEAAVLNTPPEDQAIAARVAREILFPEQHEATKAPTPEAAPAKVAPTSTAVADPTSSILGDLMSLDIDLDDLSSLSDLDALLDAGQSGEFKSFDVFEALAAGTDSERAVSRIIGRYGGPSELEAHQIRTHHDAAQFAKEQLRAGVDRLAPEDLVDAAEAGFGAVMLQEVRQPWELAGAYAGARDFGALKTHIDEILTHGTTRDIGRTLRFLEPHAGVLTGSDFTRFRETGLARARDLADHAELLDGLGRYLAPDPALVQRSAVDNVTRALSAARWIEKSFKEPLQERVFEHWADAQPETPSIDTLADLVVPSKRWDALMDAAYRRWTASLGNDLPLGDLN